MCLRVGCGLGLFGPQMEPVDPMESRELWISVVEHHRALDWRRFVDEAPTPGLGLRLGLRV